MLYIGRYALNLRSSESRYKTPEHLICPNLLPFQDRFRGFFRGLHIFQRIQMVCVVQQYTIFFFYSKAFVCKKHLSIICNGKACKFIECRAGTVQEYCMFHRSIKKTRILLVMDNLMQSTVRNTHVKHFVQHAFFSNMKINPQ